MKLAKCEEHRYSTIEGKHIKWCNRCGTIKVWGRERMPYFCQIAKKPTKFKDEDDDPKGGSKS